MLQRRRFNNEELNNSCKRLHMQQYPAREMLRRARRRAIGRGAYCLASTGAGPSLSRSCELGCGQFAD
jgi:hypothetical protein